MQFRPEEKQTGAASFDSRIALRPISPVQSGCGRMTPSADARSEIDINDVSKVAIRDPVQTSLLPLGRVKGKLRRFQRPFGACFEEV